MARYFIESIKYGFMEGGFACGPIDEPAIAEAKVKTDAGETFFMSLAIVMGVPNYFKSPESVFDIHLTIDWSDAQLEMMNSYSIETDEYSEIFRNPDHEWFMLYIYLLYIISYISEYGDEPKEAVVGKYLDEIDIPVSEMRDEYLDDEYEDDDDYKADVD